jgi:hypothetical protein
MINVTWTFLFFDCHRQINQMIEDSIMMILLSQPLIFQGLTFERLRKVEFFFKRF